MARKKQTEEEQQRKWDALSDREKVIVVNVYFGLD